MFVAEAYSGNFMTKESQLRQSIAHYGKEDGYDTQKQVTILIRMIEQAKSSTSNEAIQQRLQKAVRALSDTGSMKKAVNITNLLIAELEQQQEARRTVDFLKQKGLYRMLYRNPKFKGEDLKDDDILRVLLRNGFIGVGISLFFVAAFVAALMLSAPAFVTAIASGLFVGASVYIGGILYGVVNDLFATHANLPYFLLGHQPQQSSLLRTNDKVAQGVAWGVAATFGPVVLATGLFTVAATVTAFFVPFATFTIPAVVLAMPLIAIGAEFYARKKAREYVEEFQEDDINVGSNDYQYYGLGFMSPTNAERAAWYANSDRNLFGFTRVPLIGLGGLVGMITLSAVSMFLPAALFASPVLAVILPASIVGFAGVSILGLGAYTYINRNRQIDDRYNLNFGEGQIDYNLYLDEDQEYVKELLQAHQSTEPTITVEVIGNASPTVNYRSSSMFRPKEFEQQSDHTDEESLVKSV